MLYISNNNLSDPIYMYVKNQQFFFSLYLLQTLVYARSYRIIHHLMSDFIYLKHRLMSDLMISRTPTYVSSYLYQASNYISSYISQITPYIRSYPSETETYVISCICKTSMSVLITNTSLSQIRHIAG